MIYGEEHGEDFHCWWARNEKGGVHIWARLTTARDLYPLGFYGGIEVHSPKQRYDWMPEPSHEHCWLLCGPCWHDGSSLQFEQQVAWKLARDGFDNQLIWLAPILESWHWSHFPEV